MYAAKKDADEKQLFRLTPLLRFLPYYLISNSVPFLITHQVSPRNYGYVIRLKAKSYRYCIVLLIYLYQTPHIAVKENTKKISSAHKYIVTLYRKSALKGTLIDLMHDLSLFSLVPANAKND